MTPRDLRRRLASLFSVAKSDPFLWSFTLTLLAIDILCIGVYSVTRTMRAWHMDPGFLGRPEFRITSEGGYPEVFGYAKVLLVVIITARLARSTRQSVYFALTLVFGMILFDDSLAIHETLGAVFADSWPLESVLGTGSQHRGELLAWAILGAIGTALLWWSFRHSERSHVEIGGALLVPVVALALFAIGVDSLYDSTKDAFPGAGLLLDTVEDGGELISMTLACALTLAARRIGLVIEPSSEPATPDV